MTNFFQQLGDLRKRTQRLFNINIGSENSDYCTHSDKNKNCYLLFAANFNEDCLYGSIVISSRDCVECSNIDYCELCYECLDCLRCYNCNFSQDMRGCRDCDFCYDCISCSNCFGCVSLRQKEYCVFNEPVPKEKYPLIVANWKKRGRDAVEIEWEKLKMTMPRRSSHEMKTQNCIGDYLTDSKNCYICFNAHECEDSMYLIDVWRTKDSMDLVFSDGTELCYECFSLGLGTYNCNFCAYIRGCSDCEYCELCFSCRDCFGCVGLQNKQYYILNQPYARDAYFKKVREIKEGLKREGLYGRFNLETTYKFGDTAAAASPYLYFNIL